MDTGFVRSSRNVWAVSTDAAWSFHGRGLANYSFCTAARAGRGMGSARAANCNWRCAVKLLLVRAYGIEFVINFITQVTIQQFIIELSAFFAVLESLSS